MHASDDFGTRLMFLIHLQGMWVWLADHDLDSGGSQQISLYSGRGLMSESQGPVWLIGTGTSIPSPLEIA